MEGSSTRELHRGSPGPNRKPRRGVPRTGTAHSRITYEEGCMHRKGTSLTGPTCPAWCVTPHDPSRGEDDWLHQSEPLSVAVGVKARVCMSIDPRTREQDGPYVLVADDLLTPEETRRLSRDLSAMAALAQGHAG